MAFRNILLMREGVQDWVAKRVFSSRSSSSIVEARSPLREGIPNKLLVTWQTINLPALTDSKIKFHAQRVTNSPTESWFSSATYGAHDFTTDPLPWVLPKNPFVSNCSSFKSDSVNVLFNCLQRVDCALSRETYDRRFPIQQPFASTV